MSKNYDLPFLDKKPQTILAVADDAGAEEIRTAYLNKIKEYPPERCPEEFERIRDAYKILSDPRRRTLLMLQSADPEAPVVTLLDNIVKKRQFVGPGAWFAAMLEQ
jgi:hypothetical protein